MKKTFLFSVLSIIFLNSNAQITITSADLATIGKVVFQAHDTLPTITPGNAGASQTWNFDTLNNHKQDTMTFTNPTWGPFASMFPTSNIAVQSDGGFMYLNNSASGLEFLGQAKDSMIVKYNPVRLFLKFPATYNNSFKDTSAILKNDLTYNYQNFW